VTLTTVAPRLPMEAAMEWSRSRQVKELLG